MTTAHSRAHERNIFARARSPHHVGRRVRRAEPGLLKEWRLYRGAEDVVKVLVGGGAGRGRLDGEVPVRQGQLRVDLLQAVLEGVGQQAVVRQETEAVVELLAQINVGKEKQKTKNTSRRKKQEKLPAVGGGRRKTTVGSLERLNEIAGNADPTNASR